MFYADKIEIGKSEKLYLRGKFDLLRLEHNYRQKSCLLLINLKIGGILRINRIEQREFLCRLSTNYPTLHVSNIPHLKQI